MTDGMTNPPVGANPDLERTHSELIDLVRRLEESIDSATNAAAIGAIADQIVEINVRVTAVGRVLLSERTEEIRESTAAVTTAIREVEVAIDDIDDAQALVAGVAGLLATVDRACAVASLVRR